MPITTRPKVKNGLIVSEDQPSQSIVPSNTSIDVFDPDDRDLRLLMDEAVTKDDWLSIFSKAREMALSGGQIGIKAMDFLAKYRFGLPAQMTRGEVEKQTPIRIIEVIKSSGIKEEIENHSKPMEEEPPF